MQNKNKNINILYECKELNDVNRLLKVEWTQPKFDKEDIEEKSTMNLHRVKWIDKLDAYSTS